MLQEAAVLGGGRADDVLGGWREVVAQSHPQGQGGGLLQAAGTGVEAREAFNRAAAVQSQGHSLLQCCEGVVGVEAHASALQHGGGGEGRPNGHATWGCQHARQLGWEGGRQLMLPLLRLLWRLREEPARRGGALDEGRVHNRVLVWRPPCPHAQLLCLLRLSWDAELAEGLGENIIWKLHWRFFLLLCLLRWGLQRCLLLGLWGGWLDGGRCCGNDIKAGGPSGLRPLLEKVREAGKGGI